MKQKPDFGDWGGGREWCEVCVCPREGEPDRLPLQTSYMQPENGIIIILKK